MDAQEQEFIREAAPLPGESYEAYIDRLYWETAFPCTHLVTCFGMCMACNAKIGG